MIVRDVLALVACLAICFAPGVVGSRFGPGTWYQELEKPALTPPGWVFPVAWSLLYLLMGISLFLVWREVRPHWREGGAALALGLFLAQLVANALWSWLFFGLQRPAWALLDLAALWLLLAAALVAFWKILPVAGALLVPYLLWVSFAGYLNLSIWRMNG